MEVVIDYEELSGTQNETFKKGLSIAGENLLEAFQFLCLYALRPHGDTENGLNWDDGRIPFNQLSSVVVGFAHLYEYGNSKLH